LSWWQLYWSNLFLICYIPVAFDRFFPYFIFVKILNKIITRISWQNIKKISNTIFFVHANLFMKKNLNNLAKMASLCISHFQFFETTDRQFTPFFVTKYKIWRRNWWCLGLSWKMHGFCSVAKKQAHVPLYFLLKF
jgi:hypothetical protein